MNRKLLTTITIILIISLTWLTACSSSAGDTSGVTSISGKLDVDGNVPPEAKITLVKVESGQDGETKETVPDASGAFSFENIPPGTYYLMTVFSLPGDVSCSAKNFDILAMRGENQSGQSVTIIMPSNSQDSFEIKAGQQKKMDIIVNCK
jgi:hypothetical protein